LRDQCTAITRTGERCTLAANGQHGLCWAHDPANAEKRRRGASRGGKARANRELPTIKAKLEDLTSQVLAGELETGRAAVANQLINTRLRAIELERKIKETEELEARLEALEQEREGRGSNSYTAAWRG
jgi:septal ring factor EnvC (AmiA/AmiB activator)